MNVTCSAEACPVILNSSCVFYAGANLVYTGINTNDNLQTVIEKIDNKFIIHAIFTCIDISTNKSSFRIGVNTNMTLLDCNHSCPASRIL